MRKALTFILMLVCFASVVGVLALVTDGFKEWIPTEVDSRSNLQVIDLSNDEDNDELDQSSALKLFNRSSDGWFQSTLFKAVTEIEPGSNQYNITNCFADQGYLRLGSGEEPGTINLVFNDEFSFNYCRVVGVTPGQGESLGSISVNSLSNKPSGGLSLKKTKTERTWYFQSGPQTHLKLMSESESILIYSIELWSSESASS
jgi:hypothetical protein